MKTLFLTLLLATLCATGYGQTIKALGYNTTNNTIVGLTNTQRLAFEHISVTSGTAGAPSMTYASGTNVFGTFASTAFGIGPFLGFSVDGNRRFFISTNTIRAELPLSFNNATNEAVTRTNLGLGATWLTNDNVTNFRTNIGIPLPALTNTNNADTMRALAGSTNTNQPFSGTITVLDDGNDNRDIVISNGIILSVSDSY
jgi:hypothetical protein